ncbi:MAG: VWA domain-containing protein [Acidimicrobiales bacterium]
MKRLVAALFVAALSLVAVAPAATAAESIVIRKVDLSQFPQVVISAQVSGAGVDRTSFSLRENGKIVSPIGVVPLGQTDIPVGIALVIDVSGSMRQGSKLAAAKDAAKQFVAQKLANDQIAVVAFNQQVQVVAGFTKDSAALLHAIDGLVAAGETSLFDGVRAAATLFGDRDDLQANIVLLSDGADTTSQSNVDTAEAAVLSAKASLFAVGLPGKEFDAGSLRRLASAGGGTYTETTDPESLKGVYQTVQRDIQNQFEISYTSTATGSVTLSLAAGGRIAAFGPEKAGTVVEGVTAEPDVVGRSRFAEALSGSGSLAAVAVLVFLAAALVVVSVLALTRRGVPGLASRLEPYGPAGGSAFEVRPGSGDIELAQTAFVQRAVDATARLAKGGNVLETIETKLEAADLPVRPAEALFFYAVGVAAAVVVTGLLSGLFFALLALIVFGMAPIAVLNMLGRRRQQKFASQLPDVLRLLASSLRAGFSLLQAADATAEQMDDPMGKELRRVLVEARLGRPLEVALEDSAKRAHVPDYDWVVMAIGIQRDVGGNLAELLSTVADTMVARVRLRQEVKTLTAEGRISAIVLAALPVVIGAAVYVLNPRYLDPLLHRTSGQLMILAAIVAGIGGFVWMRKIVDIPS